METPLVSVPTFDSSPPLSIVIALRELWEPLPQLLTALTPQGREAGAEIIVVDSSARAEVPAIVESYPPARRIAAPPGTIAALRAVGVREATGRRIAFLDIFEVPAPGWCQAILDAAADQPDAVYGGSVIPGRDRTIGNMGAYLFEYAAFAPPILPGPTLGDIPGNNMAYPAARLKEVIARQPGGEFWKPFTNAILRAEGVPFILIPDMAVTHDAHYSLFPFAVRCFHFGRCFGAMRVRNAPRLRAIILKIGAPGGAILFLARLLSRACRRSAARGLLLRGFPGLLLYWMSWACGETLGAWCGPGVSCGKVHY
ncbi:glycosyltransferase [Candidatus Sumerlaeota bacterium]|nr:glycosyltransferase [Candidatus Sumerlaeota bacterium]